MADPFDLQSDLTNPADTHFEITPDDSTDLTLRPRAIYCAEDGTAQVVDRAGTVLPYAMTAGQFLPFQGVRINATDTTGTFYGWR